MDKQNISRQQGNKAVSGLCVPTRTNTRDLEFPPPGTRAMTQTYRGLDAARDLFNRRFEQTLHLRSRQSKRGWFYVSSIAAQCGEVG